MVHFMMGSLRSEGGALYSASTACVAVRGDNVVNIVIDIFTINTLILHVAAIIVWVGIGGLVFGREI